MEAPLRSLARRLLGRLEERVLERLGVAPDLDAPLGAISAFAEAALAGARARDLEARYRLGALVAPRSAAHLGTLFLLDLLDQILTLRSSAFAGLPDAPRVLDVGARNFESAPALFLAVSRLEPGRVRRVQLTGIELDADRRGPDGATWRATARAYARRVGRVAGDLPRYLAGDVLEHAGAYDLISWMHPFLDAPRLREWGLAPRHFRPRDLLAHVASLLAPGGLLLIVNQDADEDATQRALLAELGLASEAFAVDPFFRGREAPAHVHLVAAPHCRTGAPRAGSDRR